MSIAIVSALTALSGQAPVINAPSPAPIVQQAAAQQQAPANRPAPVPNQAPRLPLLGGSSQVLISTGGNRPDIWGKSRACFRMVRKNRKIARSYK